MPKGAKGKKTITRVFYTRNNEKDYIVLYKGEVVKLSKKFIDKNKLLTFETEYTIEYQSPRLLRNGKIYRYVKWKGFKKMTREHIGNL